MRRFRDAAYPVDWPAARKGGGLFFCATLAQTFSLLVATLTSRRHDQRSYQAAPGASACENVNRSLG